MRGRIAAACAAVLVGLAPAGVLACATLLDASAWAAPQRAAQARTLASALPAFSEGTVAEPPAFPLVAGEVLRAPAALSPSIWRSPSGPAPSQAPPAV